MVNDISLFAGITGTAFNNQKYFLKKEYETRIIVYITTYKCIGWNKPALRVTMDNKIVSLKNNVHPGNKLDDVYSDAQILSILEILGLKWLLDDLNILNWASDNFITQVFVEAFPLKFSLKLLEKIPGDIT